MKNDTWAYCPDRQGTCGLLIADAERMERDAERIAELHEEHQRLANHLRVAVSQIAQLADEIDRINAECNAWSNRAKIAEANHEVTRRNMQRELRDAERENASLRRRLAVGGR
jgi:predicted RNase H-like nuclease (RuvC/YqgF family)